MPSLPLPSCRIAAVLVLSLGAIGSPLESQQSPAPGPGITWWHAAAAVGVYAALTTVDDQLERWVRDHRSETGNGIARIARRMGEPEVFIPAGLGVLATGVLSGNRRIREAGVRITSSLVLAGAVVTLGKFSAGRVRPSRSNTDADDFRPFSGNASAPSGHATMAFALATALGDEIHTRWVTIGLYTAAAAAGWSRINDNAHWTSDVMAGAALGIVSAKFVSGRLRVFGLRSPLVSAAPNGATLSWSGTFQLHP
ncbi:MAG: phosphatase PAP2 family protein [Gemmatimonadota bacterium]